LRVKPSVLKCHADKIALPPDHAAPADGVKIIECQFKARRQDVKVSQLYSRAATGDIPNPASEYAALRIEKYQRALRDRRSADGSSFNHRSPPVKLKPRMGNLRLIETDESYNRHWHRRTQSLRPWILAGVVLHVALHCAALG
jgi:hypothetical protein